MSVTPKLDLHIPMPDQSTLLPLTTGDHSSPIRTRVYHQRTLRLVIVVLVLASLGPWTFGYSHPLAPSGWSLHRKPSGTRVSVPEDPTAGPGWLVGNTWHPADPKAEMHTWYEKLEDRAADLEWAKNRTILLLGDSILREFIWAWSDAIQTPKVQVNWTTEGEPTDKTSSWMVEHPTTHLRFMNAFIYGMTDYSEPDANNIISAEWPQPGPWSFEDRLPEIGSQFARYDIDLILVNSGAWDYKYLFRRDMKNQVFNSDILPEDLELYGSRLRKYLQLLPKFFPKSKLVWLEQHPFDGSDYGMKYYWARGLVPDFDFTLPPHGNLRYPDLFTHTRVRQLPAVYRQIVKEEGMDTLDAWKLDDAIWGGILPGNDQIHPAREPGTRVLTSWTFEKLWRWVEYGV